MKNFYFYHLVDKNASLEHGLISLEYMYNNKLYDLFDKSAFKYIDRITSAWNIEKYKGKEKLTREEIIDALKIFRGEQGANYIYFFKYPLYKDLGSKIEELSKYKDIYRIDINNPEVKSLIEDIFYGYDMSDSDNRKLDREYYENVSKEDYFSKYDDTLQMNFKTLNHISISFKNGCIPLKYLEKVEWE